MNNKKRKEEEMAEGNETLERSPENKKNKEENSPQGEEILNTASEGNQKLLERLSEVENKYLRALADYQNLQKRTVQEKEELYKYAAQKTIEILLPALDTFDYATSTLKADTKPEKIVEDFSLVFEMLLKCLKDIGLETVDQTGIQFDPVIHEPLHQIPNNEVPDHTVLQVLKKGYILNKKVIRPALVAVSVRQEEG